MKWSSVKNILLGMLIVMNIFTLAALAVRRATGRKIPPVVISAAVETMEKNGISCEKELLAEEYLTAENLNVSFPTPMELSKMFFGSQRAFQTEGRALIAHDGEAELIVEDERFSYSTGAQPAEADEEQLRAALKRLGLDMRRGAYSPENNIFCCYYNGRPLFGMYVRAELDAGGELCAIEARWPRIAPLGSYRSGINILSHLPNLRTAFPGGGTVEHIRFGYSLSKSSTTGRYEVLPAWRVVMEDGRSRIFEN